MALDSEDCARDHRQDWVHSWGQTYWCPLCFRFRSFSDTFD